MEETKHIYYGVARGFAPGVYETYKECLEQIYHCPEVYYKQFKTKAEAEAFVVANNKKMFKKERIITYKKLHPRYYIPFDKKGRTVYTDGACDDNGYYYARAGYGVTWMNKVKGKKDVYGDVPAECVDNKWIFPTNNRAELTAAIMALKQCEGELDPVTVKCDSLYVVIVMNSYVHRWEEKGYVLINGNPPANMDLIKELYKLTTKIPVRFFHIPDHQNQAADKLSKQGKEMAPVIPKRIHSVYVTYMTGTSCLYDNTKSKAIDYKDFNIVYTRGFAYSRDNQAGYEISQNRNFIDCIRGMLSACKLDGKDVQLTYLRGAIMAAIVAIEKYLECSKSSEQTPVLPLVVVCDNSYVYKTMNIYDYHENDFKKEDKSTPSHVDLIKRLYELAKKTRVRFDYDPMTDHSRTQDDALPATKGANNGSHQASLKSEQSNPLTVQAETAGTSKKIEATVVPILSNAAAASKKK